MDILDYAKLLPEGGLHLKHDPKNNLIAIIAIDRLINNLSSGGCRYVYYKSFKAAIIDAIKLAKAMNNKAILAKLPIGGAKAVILKPQEKLTTMQEHNLLKSFATFVNQLNGCFITGVDLGTTNEHIDIMSQYSPYVLRPSKYFEPEKFTAQGVLAGMQAAIDYKYNNKTFADLTITIQGLGKVGWELAKLLHEKNANLVLTDVDNQLLSQAQKQFNAKIVNIHDIYQTNCDIFAPCSIGGVINKNTVPLLANKIIAGAANNQLINDAIAKQFEKYNILYLPDYIINAGGIMSVYYYQQSYNKAQIKAKINDIYFNCKEVLNLSNHNNISIIDAANILIKNNEFSY